MAMYMRGNLAVEERQISAQRVKIKETRKVVYRAGRLPAQEKLLYLCAVLVCVLVGGFVIERYAQIYQMNTRIHNVEKQISHLEVENSALKEKLSKMSDPEKLGAEASKYGLAAIPDKNLVRVPSEAKGAKEPISAKPQNP